MNRESSDVVMRRGDLHARELIPKTVPWCRVHTLMLPVVNEIGELYNTADGGAMATLIAKLAIEKSYQSKLEETRNAIQVTYSPLLFYFYWLSTLLPYALHGLAF